MPVSGNRACRFVREERERGGGGGWSSDSGTGKEAGTLDSGWQVGAEVSITDMSCHDYIAK